MVSLVDDGDLKVALHHVAPGVAQVVAQVVEADLSQRAVHDVVAVGAPTFSVAHVTQHDAYRQAQELVGRGEELGITQGEVIVRGYDVHLALRQRLRDGGEGSSDGLALARVHLDDGTVEHQPSRRYLLVRRLEAQCVGKGRLSDGAIKLNWEVYICEVPRRALFGHVG